MKDEQVIIGGEYKEATYKEFQEQMNMINVAFAEVMMEGDAKGRIFTFPIPTYNITKNFDWNNKNLEPIWEMTAKYGIPYFSNFINSEMSPDDARSMCCRLRLDNRELIRRGGGLFGSNPLTGSIGVVTINLPRLGFLSKNKEEFFLKLKNVMTLAKDSLEIKRKVLEEYTELGLYPYSKYYLSSVHDRYQKYWGNHFSTIGLVGMNECLLNFLKQDITSKEGHDFAIEILDFMRSVITEYQEETKHLYNLEATPAEGVSYRLPNIDKKQFPNIIVANDKIWKLNNKIAPYYTNSTQLPVNYTDDLFEALELQDDLQTKYTGGTVFHIFLGERMPNTESVKLLVKKIASSYHLPYFTLSPTFSVCPSHGYISGEKYKCPTCQAKCEVYSRIVGYIRPLQNWHEAKRAEFEDRKLFNMIM
jgi:ribonucleoside-triphosphate reductase